jgi:hypothetical protein
VSFWTWLKGDGGTDLIPPDYGQEMVQRPTLAPLPTEPPSPPLSAATGWCAPSEVIYDFMDLPKLQVRRGGIRWPIVTVDRSGTENP